MFSSSARPWAFFLALALALSWGTLSASGQDVTPSESDGNSKSSGLELPISGSSAPAMSESLSPEQAFERLIAEWESFEQAWLAFYPTLVRWGIEFDELPLYLNNLESSLESERGARAAETEAATKQAVADAIALEEANERADSEKRSKERWRTGGIIGWGLAGAGGIIIFLLARL